MSLSMGLFDVLGGISPDFGLVAQKVAGSELLKTFDASFIAEYGVSQEQLCQRYYQFLESQIKQAILISFGRVPSRKPRATTPSYLFRLFMALHCPT